MQEQESYSHESVSFGGLPGEKVTAQRFRSTRAKVKAIALTLALSLNETAAR